MLGASGAIYRHTVSHARGKGDKGRSGRGSGPQRVYGLPRVLASADDSPSSSASSSPSGRGGHELRRAQALASASPRVRLQVPSGPSGRSEPGGGDGPAEGRCHSARSWSCPWLSTGHSAADEAGGASPADGGPALHGHQEELLKSLSELTRMRNDQRGVPPDFRLQLQLLECSFQQRRLLQQVAEQQRLAAVQLEKLYCQGTKCQEMLQGRLEEMRQCLEEMDTRMPQQGAKVGAAVPEGVVLEDVLLEQRSRKAEASTSVRIGKEEGAPCSNQAAPWGVRFGATSSEEEGPGRASSQGSGGSPMSVTNSHEVITNHFRKAMSSFRSRSTTKELHGQGLLERIVHSTAFDLFCSAVIVFNALTIGISTQESIKWEIEHVGRGEKVPSGFISTLEYAFLCFYIFELLAKLVALRCGFFRSADARWNMFDLLLVLVGIYDVAMNAIGAVNEDGAQVTWIRMLRLARMVKMLRVVRVMRLFRVLRMMVAALAGHVTTLFWTMVMLTLLMYVFGLCFLQGIRGYLSDTPAGEMPEETMEAIRTYWSSVWQSMNTLYYAVTGGSDWEPLAKPLRQAGEVYYVIFLFYISFIVFAVLNVLTGLYAEEACKVSEKDEEVVGDELTNCKETVGFREFMADPEGFITYEDFKVNLDKAPVKKFLQMAEVTPRYCKKVFKMLDSTKQLRVPMDDFVDGCFRAKSTALSLEIMALGVDAAKCLRLQNSLEDMIRERFNEVTRALSGIKGSLPRSHVEEHPRGSMVIP